MNGKTEFDRQMTNLISRGYHKVVGTSEEKFARLLAPLKKKVPARVPETDMERGSLPFVIVVKSELVSAKKQMSLVKREGKRGVRSMYPHEPEDFKATIATPKGSMYLLFGIDRGKDSLNVTPAQALKDIVKKKRTPLTIEEGIALITHFPEFLKKNNCFSLLASRYTGDKRVPAIWINGKKEPNLGWCWEGNPHAWLGSASAKKRI
jgi:hypothetical protein